MNFRKISLVCFFTFFIGVSFSQIVKFDTLAFGSTSIIEDNRISQLGEKLMNYNISLGNKARSSEGYRLMVLNTNERSYAMEVRSKLLNSFPEHKVYMIFMSPSIKLKIGNFTDKIEAEKVRSQILASKIVKGNVYLLPEKVEVRLVKKE